MPSLEYDNLELIRKNPSQDGEAYRGTIDGKDTLVKIAKEKPEVERLYYEAEVLRQLEGSPHVPEFYGIHTGDQNETYLAEQFVQGTSLKDILGPYKEHGAKEPPLSPYDAAGIVNRIGAAEKDLIRRGVMYRDLQTVHVIFAEDDNRAVFVDLGLATTESYKDSDGQRKWVQTGPNGTYKTMSPAELRGEDMTEADVVYRLAVIYHFAITGELPFSHPKRAEIETWVKDPAFKLSDRLTPDGKELFENSLYGDPKRQIKSIDLFLHHMNRLKNQMLTASASPTPA